MLQRIYLHIYLCIVHSVSNLCFLFLRNYHDFCNLETVLLVTTEFDILFCFCWTIIESMNFHFLSAFEWKFERRHDATLPNAFVYKYNVWLSHLLNAFSVLFFQQGELTPLFLSLNVTVVTQVFTLVEGAVKRNHFKKVYLFEMLCFYRIQNVTLIYQWIRVKSCAWSSMPTYDNWNWW